MSPDLLRYYSRELQHLRQMGAEFAAAYPKVAGRLGLEGFECADPYVERLLEGFSFLAARVQMKLDHEYPAFTQHLTELIYPELLAPTPSMAVVRFEPDLSHPGLESGASVPRHTALYSHFDRDGTTRCEYRTAHPVELWPLQLAEAQYRLYGGEAHTDAVHRPKAALRLRLELPATLRASQLSIDRLPIYLCGAEGIAARLYEQLLGNLVSVAVVPAAGSSARPVVLDRGCVTAMGFDNAHALFPQTGRAFDGFRLLHEYFAFPQRFLFVQVEGIRAALRDCDTTSLELVFLLNRHEQDLERLVDVANFGLYCTPAINLFPWRGDRIAISGERFEYQVVADRTRPLDFEVYAVQSVRGFRANESESRRFEPLYRARDPGAATAAGGAYFQVRREARARSEREQRHGGRSRYAGSEVFVALVDADESPCGADLQQVGVDLLCTNRDLPITMPVGVGQTDFTFSAEFPVVAVRCVAGPTAPRAGLAEGPKAWRLINQLSLNYLPLVDGDQRQDAHTLRELLESYCPIGDNVGQEQIAGVCGLTARPVTRRLPYPGPISFGRGLELTLSLDEASFEGAGAFLFGAVLQAFFSTYVSINHFTQTVVRSTTRGEIMRWPARAGLCQVL